MPHYVRIRDLPEDFDWSNGRHGRRVQCPKCGLGVTMYITALEAACTQCRCECEVLTADSTAVRNLPGRKSRPESPQSARKPEAGREGFEQVAEAS